jgi:chloramphenicol O-acetyltransferase
MKVMNAIDNFKYRFVDKEPYLFETIHPSFTDLIEGTDQFKIVTVDYLDDGIAFIQHAKQQSIKQGSTFIDLTHEIRQDLVYVTTFPWARFSQVSHAHIIDPYDAIPRVVWGKFEDVNGRKVMPFSISVHHAFVDGFHVGMFIQHLQDSLK